MSQPNKQRKEKDELQTFKHKIEAQQEETYRHMVEYGTLEGIEDPTRSKCASEGYDYEAGFYDGLGFVLFLLTQMDNS